MAFYLIKIVLTTALVILISEITKRSSLFGALFASLPLVSLLAILWLYIETGDGARIRAFSIGIFWLTLPSLAFFALLPLLLRQGVSFYPALTAALAATILVYGLMIFVLSHFGIRL